MNSRLGLKAFALAAALSMIACSGCGKAKRVWTFNNEVEGVVKLAGAPIPNVIVQFVPDDPTEQGPISSGVTDPKGHFRLSSENEQDGAVTGPHKVVVIAGRSESGARIGPSIPATFRTVKDTTLKVEVTPDKHSYELELKR